MGRLFLGIAVLVIGIVLFVTGIYYGWLVATPGVSESMQETYAAYSRTFGYLSYAVLVGGILTIVFSIRKLNLEHRRQQKKEENPIGS